MTGRISSAIRGAVFWSTAGLFIAISMVMAMFVCWHRRWAFAALRGGYRILAPTLLWIAGVTVRQQGVLPAWLRGTGYVLISNHSSNLDVLCLERAMGYPGLSVVIKSEVWRLPVLGWYLRGLGWIGVDRGQPGAAARLITSLDGEHRVGGPPQILIFPEGTRTRDGGLQRFRLGPFLMALHLQLPIVPVIIRGARACHPRGALGFRAGVISLELAQPLTPPALPVALGSGPASQGRPVTDDEQYARLARVLQQQAHALYQDIELDRAI